MQEISDYLDSANLEVSGDPDVIGEAFIDQDGDEVQEVGARVRRRGGGGPFRFRRLKIPAGVVRAAEGMPIRGARRNAYAAPDGGGAMTPFAVGTLVGPGTLTIEPQIAFQPHRALITCNDGAAPPVDVAFRCSVTEIKVGARSMLRAGGAASGLPALLFSDGYRGANPAQYDLVRPGTQFSITIATGVATDVTTVCLVGRAS